jgi:hypothetical protein
MPKSRRSACVDIVSTTFDGRLPVDAIAFSLPGMFAILAVGITGVVIALGTALTAAPLLWGLSAVFLFFASFPADTVREAEQLKTRVATVALSKSPLPLRPSPRRLSTTTWAACWPAPFAAPSYRAPRDVAAPATRRM